MIKSEKLNHAVGLYLDGIRDGNARDAIDKHTGDRYTQHSTGVADGKEGFVDFFTSFVERNPVRDIQVVRAIEDGRYVFCHVYQNLNNGAAKWVTADLFDTDENDRLIEHWDVIAEFVEDTASGRGMIDGPTEVEELDKTDANKAIVRGFVDDVLTGGQTNKIPDYISSDQYHQHNPMVEDGIAGFEKYLTAMMESGRAMQYVKVHRLIGQGNFGVVYSHVKMGDDDYAIFDIFRLSGGKIVEHWDVQEKIGPKESWNNSGKF